MARKPNSALIYQRVPEHLRKMRETAGLTQRVLAARLRKTQSWVARCETGDRRIDIAEWIEWALGCDVRPEASLAALVEKRK